MGMHSQVIFHPQPLPTPPEISAPYAAGFFKTVYDDRAAADADTTTYYEKGEAYFIWCEADTTTTEDAKIYTCTAAGTTATGTFTATTPASNCIYQRLDTLEIMQFYKIEPDTENYINAGGSGAVLFMSELSLNPNCYLLGQIALKSSGGGVLSFTKCNTGLNIINITPTTSWNNITIPIKVNGVFSRSGTNVSIYIGFKAAGT